MMHEDDLDLERRLRRISRDPEPLISGTASRYLRNLADGDAAFVDLGKLQRPGGPFLLRMPKSAAIGGLAAAMILVLAGGLFLAPIRPNSPAASSPPTAPWSALDWRDITDTAFPSFTGQRVGWSSNGMSIVSWKGLLIADPPSRGLWSSPDGQTWTAHSNLPDLTAILTTKNWLLGIGAGRTTCPAEPGVSCNELGSIWYSSDGLAWKEAQVPFTNDVIAGVAASGSVGVVLVSSSEGDAMKNPATPYASTDGATWTKASVPPDMAGALMTSIDSTRAGFVVSGFVEGAGGDIQWSVQDGGAVSTFSGFDRSWFSADGLSWASYDTGLAGASHGQLPPVYSGSLGDAIPFAFPGLHSTDGLNWLQDEGGPAAGMGGQAFTFVSDGTEIIAAQDGPVFWFSRGDGRWGPLQNGGTLGSLPSAGQVWVVPNGVIYDAGGRIYFGRALSGVTITETLRPGPPVQYPTVPAATSSIPPLLRGGLEPAADWSK